MTFNTLISHQYNLGQRVQIGDDRCIMGTVFEIIWRKNCIRPLYQIGYWLDGKLIYEVLPEEDVYPYD